MGKGQRCARGSGSDVVRFQASSQLAPIGMEPGGRRRSAVQAEMCGDLSRPLAALGVLGRTWFDFTCRGNAHRLAQNPERSDGPTPKLEICGYHSAKCEVHAHPQPDFSAQVRLTRCQSPQRRPTFRFSTGIRRFPPRWAPRPGTKLVPPKKITAIDSVSVTLQSLARA